PPVEAGAVGARRAGDGRPGLRRGAQPARCDLRGGAGHRPRLGPHPRVRGGARYAPVCPAEPAGRVGYGDRRHLSPVPGSERDAMAPVPLSINDMEMHPPYGEQIKTKAYEAELRLLQIELLKLQRSVREEGRRIVILFEGRDAAGKGGSIKRFMENLNPRGGRVVARSDPLRRWKLSPIDEASLGHFDDYTEARNAMFFYTDTPESPWTVVNSNEKKRARLESIRTVLHSLD